MINIEARHLKILRDILSKVGVSFYVFGSRAKGTNRKFSDLDLIYKEPIDIGSLGDIRYQLEESNLPYKVDIINYHDCKDSFIDLIKQDLIELDLK
ncbi:MAG: nucleotidyltransferase domain-containing protein [Candidatus Melainabacteria bacterium]|jgi:predicted nucleotidyltransferase|nr:nucleotidyltransferase domain-containing protein [Candidatus Melainabacteria bacterium]